MKAGDFRIGNFVYGVEEGFTETAMEICSLHSDNTYRLKFGSDSVGCYGTKWIHPIPITKEWLLKFGFENFIGWYHYPSNKGTRWAIDIHHFDSDVFFWKTGAQSVRLKFVHQLQNLYFALTGTELELKFNP